MVMIGITVIMLNACVIVMIGIIVKCVVAMIGIIVICHQVVTRPRSMVSYLHRNVL